MPKSFTSFFSSGIGAVIKAVLLLILAFIVAAIVKSIIVKLLGKTKWAQNSNPADPDGSSAERAIVMIGKLAQLIVFLIFVPGIFEALGLTSVSTPILSMLNTVWGYLPNVLAAGIILWVGFYVAKLVRELLIPLFNKLEVNKLQKIAGIEVSESGQLSNTLAYLIYVLILIPVIITALQVLNISAVSGPAIEMLNIIFAYIPRILAALVIIIIGWIIARFIGEIITRLIAASGIDAKVAGLLGDKSPKCTFSEIVGKAVQIILVIFFVVEGCASLKLEILTTIGTDIIAYMPYVLAACIIFAIAFLISAVAGKALKASGHAPMAIVVKYAVYTVAAFLILNSLGIAKTLVDGAFLLIIAALAIAFAIAFGVGGRKFASIQLDKLEKKISEK